MRQKSAQNFQAAFDRPRVAALAPQQAQQKFGMQILADFVDHANILQQRLRFVAGKRDRLIGLRGRAGPSLSSLANLPPCDGAMAVTLKVDRVASSVWRVRWCP